MSVIAHCFHHQIQAILIGKSERLRSQRSRKAIAPAHRGRQQTDCQSVSSKTMFSTRSGMETVLRVGHATKQGRRAKDLSQSNPERL